MRGAERAAALTQRLLAFSRQQPLQPKVLDVSRLVGGMSDLLRRSLGEQISIETVLAGGLWRVHADPNQLEVAILNLAVNARDAMPDGGKLTIETANVDLDDSYAADCGMDVIPGEYVVICVTDTGTRHVAGGASNARSSRSSPPRMSVQEPGSACPRSTVSSSSRAATSRSTPRSDKGTTVKLYLPRLHGAAEDEVCSSLTARIAAAQPSVRDHSRGRG